MDRLMEPAVLDAPAAVSADETATVSLVERARNGDPVAFEGLLRDRLDGLFRTAWAILGDESDARDATQDACIAAWKNLRGLREPERFDAWLGRVLVNGCRMRLRTRTRVREIRLQPGYDRPGPATDDPSTTADADLVARAFDRLDADARSILVLHHLRHEPITSIAVALGVPPGTVKSRLHTARASLARAIEMERR
jgi:RNA polymerase sigma-70 factor (ECF subfamily)